MRRVEVDGRRATFRRARRTSCGSRRAAALAAGQVFRVSVRYRGVPRTVVGSPIAFGEPYGFLHTRRRRSSSAAEPDAASTWFPCNDHPSDKATYTFRITVPEGLTRRSPTARLVDRATRRGRTTFVWNEDSPMASYLATVDIGRWKVKTAHAAAAIPETVAVDPRLARQAQHAVRYFFDTHRRGRPTSEATVFGPYPFELDRGDRRRRASRRPARLRARDADPAGLLPAIREHARRSPTSWRTSGSATACRCAAGRTSGSTRASRRTPSGCGSSTTAPRHCARRSSARVHDAGRGPVLEGRDRQPAARTRCSPSPSTTAGR